jgi:hypothetical protein
MSGSRLKPHRRRAAAWRGHLNDLRIVVSTARRTKRETAQRLLAALIEVQVATRRYDASLALGQRLVEMISPSGPALRPSLVTAR